MLEGVRVVVLGSGTPVSMFAALLGDQGCDVVRVEPPGAGDPLRWARPARRRCLVGVGGGARSSRGVTCDPSTDDGRRLLARLLATADVIGEALGPLGLERLGLAPDALRGPGVVVRFSGGGYGAGDTPELVALAEGGMLALTGHPERLPVPLGVRYAEQFAAIAGAMAALAALLAGHGPDSPPATAHIATKSAVLRVTEWTVPACDLLGFERGREGNRPSSVAPLDVYLTADDTYLAIVGGSDANFTRLVRVMERPELRTDPRYTTPAARVERSNEINELVAACGCARGRRPRSNGGVRRAGPRWAGSPPPPSCSTTLTSVRAVTSSWWTIPWSGRIGSRPRIPGSTARATTTCGRRRRSGNTITRSGAMSSGWRGEN